MGCVESYAILRPKLCECLQKTVMPSTRVHTRLLPYCCCSIIPSRFATAGEFEVGKLNDTGFGILLRLAFKRNEHSAPAAAYAVGPLNTPFLLPQRR